MTLEQCIWQWLPARPDRRRVTTIEVAAANLGLDPVQTALVFVRMERAGTVVRNRRGDGWHRGLPC